MKDFLKKVYENSYKIVGVLILIYIAVLVISWLVMILISIH